MLTATGSLDDFGWHGGCGWSAPHLTYGITRVLALTGRPGGLRLNEGQDSVFHNKKTSYRLLPVVMAAAVLPMGVIAATGGTAGAAVKVDATNYTATCTGFAGSVKFSKPETTAGTTTPSPATDALKGALTGCTVDNGTGTPMAVTSGKLSGSLTNPSSYHKCGGSSGVPIAVTGSVAIKWKTSPKLTAASTVITASTATLSIVVASDAVNFTINGASATGPFGGSNSGASDAVAGSTGVGSGSGLLASCATKKGLKGLTLASPLSGNAADLG